MKEKHTKYTHINRNMSMHSEIGPQNCKNRSRKTRKCAYDCAQLQYTIQHRTVLIISPLMTHINQKLTKNS